MYKNFIDCEECAPLKIKNLKIEEKHDPISIHENFDIIFFIALWKIVTIPCPYHSNNL